MTGERGRAGRTVVLSLGSNLGDRLANLQLGIKTLCDRDLACRSVSGVYQTVPVGGPHQGDYLNIVLLAESSLPAHEILAKCHAAERAAERVRSGRWGPRTLDVDIIACGAEMSTDPELTLPHPRAYERAFVLVPWLEVAPDASLPGRGPIGELLAAIGTSGVTPMPEMRLTLPETDAVVAGGGGEASSAGQRGSP